MKEPVNILVDSFERGLLSVSDFKAKMDEHKSDVEEENVWLCVNGEKAQPMIEVIYGEDDVKHRVAITEEQAREFIALKVEQV